MNTNDIAKEVFDIESRMISNLKSLLTKDFEDAVNLILSIKGKLIVSGMGKSGIIGKKIAATLASTGTPSFFLHPGEAYHGDLGMIEDNDVLLLLSNSGETDEVLKLVPFLKYNKNSIISMTGNPDSTLAKNSDYHLNIYVEEEACPLQLAPTSSTTTTLVMGDALAVALMKLRKFKDTDFARFHPGGSLGKKLLTTVEMVMQKDNLPVIDKKTISIDIVHAITNGRCGLCVVVDDKKNILGIITDGDLRRNMEKNKEKFFNITAEELMTKYPKSVNKNTGIVDAENLMISNGINALLVEETNQLVGIVQIYNI